MTRPGQVERSWPALPRLVRILGGPVGFGLSILFLVAGVVAPNWNARLALVAATVLEGLAFAAALSALLLAAAQ